MDVCSNKLGISKSSTSFVLPLGAAINMDGMAIYLGICTLFFAQAYNVDLSTVDYLIIILTSTLGSIGAAGMPSGTIIMLPMVLSAVGIPIEGIAFIAGIDRILDMMRTTLNITGDATITLLIDASENTLNKKIYNTESSKLSEGEEGESKLFEKTSK
jgi:Na+/H+-dicarboxylate symporter